MPTCQNLNERFGLPDQLHFEPGPRGLIVAAIATPAATARVALHGAHVLSYIPEGQEEVLWLSRCSHYEAARPIRGGIPVCWPWFGAHPDDAEQPSHGFARLREWQVVATEPVGGDAVRLRLALEPDADSLERWPHNFRLELVVTVGAELRVSLVMANPGSQPYTCTAALHTYFAVGDVTRTTVRGLEGGEYIDTVGGRNTRHRQDGPVTFDQEVDRIYLDTEATCRIEAPGRTVEVAKEGSRTTVVWNPWIAKAARMPDFGDDEYTSMLCVETANTRQDPITVAPAATHTTTAIIRPSSLTPE